MADGPHFNEGEITRREHNEPARSKRTLQVGFDYSEEEYKVLGVDANGAATVKEKNSQHLNERLEVIETTMRVLLLHAQMITGEAFTDEDLE